jgi:2'-5' RNA ligase
VRVFIAIEVPENIQKEVFSLKNNISSDYVKIRWVKEENIHLTMIFLGEIAEDVIEQVKDRMQVVSKRHKVFNMALQGSGAFPNLRRPRVIWVGVSSNSEQPIINLANDLTITLDFLKLDDKRTFKPHITFGRIRSVYNLGALQRGIESISINTEEFTVKEITLFKSTLKPDGAVYTPLSKYPLQPNGL